MNNSLSISVISNIIFGPHFLLLLKSNFEKININITLFHTASITKIHSKRNFPYQIRLSFG